MYLLLSQILEEMDVVAGEMNEPSVLYRKAMANLPLKFRTGKIYTKDLGDLIVMTKGKDTRIYIDHWEFWKPDAEVKQVL